MRKDHGDDSLINKYKVQPGSGFSTDKQSTHLGAPTFLGPLNLENATFSNSKFYEILSIFCNTS